MTEYLLPLGIISLLIVANALCVAAEFAIVSAPYTRIAHQAEAGSRAARQVLSALRNPDKRNGYIATAQVGITLSSLGLGMFGEHSIAEWLLGPLESFGRPGEAAAHTIAVTLSVMLLTYLHVVLGEMVPKSLAIQYAERVALTTAGPMTVLQKLFHPMVYVLSRIANSVVRLAGVPMGDTQDRFFSPAELEFIVEESAEGGLLDPAEQLYLENIFDFQERTVDQVMTPRTKVIGLPISAGEAEVLTQICRARHSRYPVYDRDMDHILGILHLKAVARQQVNRPGTFDLAKLIRPVVFVPDSLSLQEMRTVFRQNHSSLAMVVDEYGGTAGVVTVEDLVEEIVGEILDEFDQEQPPIQEQEPGLVLVRGDLILEELNQHYDLTLQSEDVDTVGGLVMSLLGRVPKPGDVVEEQGIRFEVQSVDGLAVEAVLVRMPSQTDFHSSGES